MVGQPAGIVILSWTYMFLTLLLVINRLSVRMFMRGGVLSSQRVANWSDALVVVAWFFNLFQTIGNTVMYAKGAMVYVDRVDVTIPGNIEKIIIEEKILYATSVIYYVSLYCIKGAILCFLLEITPPVLKHIRRAIWAGCVLSAVGLVATVFIYIFSCNPISWWWDYYTEASCYTATVTTTLAICYHVFTDLYVYTIPFFLISKLKIISRSQRLATGAMFGVGFLVVCFSIPQMISAWVPALWRQYPWSFWCCPHELGLAILVACLPAARLTFQRWRKSHAGGAESPKRRSFFRGDMATKEVAQTAVEMHSNEFHSSGNDTLTNSSSNQNTKLGTEKIV